MARAWSSAGAVCLLFLGAAALRLPLLDRRPMHADEAILADKFGTLLATGTYAYDPHEYHGPVLAYLAWIPARLSGRTTYAALTETTVRLAPAMAGIGAALSPLLLVPAIGASAAIAAAALVAVSPVMVYYSRDFIPEMPLALWTALFLAALYRPGAGWRAMSGAAAGLMIATKENAWLALAAAAFAYAVAFHPRWPGWRSMVVFLAGLAASLSLLLAPPWKWAILLQAIGNYAGKGVSGGLHAHPWYAYLQWLAGWHYAFTEAPVLVLAGGGFAIAIRSKRPFVRFLAVYAIALLALDSLLPYKTPWCAVSLLYALALLGGVGMANLVQRWRAAAAAFSAVIIGGLAWQAWLASVPYASDLRNPWAYAQTGTGVFAIRDRVLQVTRAAPDGPAVAIDVYTRENFWPLPWYLRACRNVRWWRGVAIPGRAAPIVLLSPDMELDLVRKLYQGPPPGERELYLNLFPSYVELRPRVEVRGYVAKSLWDRAGASR